MGGKEGQTDWILSGVMGSPMVPQADAKPNGLSGSSGSSGSSSQAGKAKEQRNAAGSFRCGHYKNLRSILRFLVKGCWIPEDAVAMSEDPQLQVNDTEDPRVEPSYLNSLPEDLWLECLARVPRSSLQTSMMVCRKWRNTLKSGELYEVRRHLGRVENLLFVFGGAGTGLASAVLSKSSGGWKAGLLCTLKALDENKWLLDYHSADHCLIHAQPAVVKHKIFILGATPSCSASAEGGREYTIVYDAWTKTLTRGSPMSSLRKKFATCVISDRVYVAGGSNRDDSGREALVGAEEYIPELDIWRPLPNMPKRRYGCLGAAVNGIFYVIGGLKFNSVLGTCMQPYYVGSMDSFNPKTGLWQKTLKLPMKGCVIACTVVGTSIYMLSSMAVELSFWKYDTVGQDGAGQFTRIRPPPVPPPLRIDHCVKFSCVTMGSSVYIIQVGGSIDDLMRRTRRPSRARKDGLVLIYDTITGEWSRGPDLPYGKKGATCAVVLC